MANFQTVYAWITLVISLTMITSFFTNFAIKNDPEAFDANMKFLMVGSISFMFIILVGSIVNLVLRLKKR